MGVCINVKGDLHCARGGKEGGEGGARGVNDLTPPIDSKYKTRGSKFPEKFN